MTDNNDFDWGELGAAFWLDAAKSIGATERHAQFACSKHNGKTNTQAAHDAGYGGGSNPGSVRSEGYRLLRSNKIGSLLAMAVAESGGGYDGTVTRQESKTILSRLARGSDPALRIKSVELLNKFDREEQALIANQPEETLEQTLGHIITAVPYQGVGAFLSLSSFISGGGFIASYPYLTEVAPTICRYYPDLWQKWRIKEQAQWVWDFLDKAASDPVLDDDELVAAVKRKMPTAAIVRPKPSEATNDAA